MSSQRETKCQIKIRAFGAAGAQSAPKWLFDLQKWSQKAAKSQWKRPSCWEKQFILQKTRSWLRNRQADHIIYDSAFTGSCFNWNLSTFPWTYLQSTVFMKGKLTKEQSLIYILLINMSSWVIVGFSGCSLVLMVWLCLCTVLLCWCVKHFYKTQYLLTMFCSIH